MSELDLNIYYGKDLILKLSPGFSSDLEKLRSAVDEAIAKVSKFNAAISPELIQSKPACCFCDDDGNPCNYCNKLPSILREQAS